TCANALRPPGARSRLRPCYFIYLSCRVLAPLSRPEAGTQVQQNGQGLQLVGYDRNQVVQADDACERPGRIDNGCAPHASRIQRLERLENLEVARECQRVRRHDVAHQQAVQIRRLDELPAHDVAVGEDADRTLACVLRIEDDQSSHRLLTHYLGCLCKRLIGVTHENLHRGEIFDLHEALLRLREEITRPWARYYPHRYALA